MRYTLLLLLLFSVTLPGQDLCTTFQPGPGQSCKDIDPQGEFDVYYCEWFVDSHGVIDYIENDRVDFETFAEHFSGYHTHGYSIFNSNQRPPILISVLGPNGITVGPTGWGYTGLDGCIKGRIFMNGFSGKYFLTGLSLTAAAEGQPADTLVIGAHEKIAGKWALVTALGPMTQSPYMEQFSQTGYDAQHTGDVCNQNGLCNFFMRGQPNTQFQHLAQRFYTISSGDKLRVLRAGCPQGGICDSDKGESLNALGGNWHSSVRSVFEWHIVGDEADIRNPSLAVGDVMGVKIAQLGVAMTQTACSYGKIKPEGNGPADIAFWAGRQNVHIACGRSLVDLLPIQ